jgi:hypothetical protein
LINRDASEPSWGERMDSRVLRDQGNQATMTERTGCRRSDNLFFSSMAVAILLSVCVGFARTYYLAGMFKAPLPNLLIHVHGAVFSCWIILLMIQTSVVAARRLDVHRRVGLLGFVLACLMVVLGLLAATDFEVRHFVPGEAGMRIRAFYTIPLSAMLSFAILVYFAFRHRFNPAAHKRLILIATIAILDAAFQRWPMPAAWWGDRAASVLCTILLLLLIAGTTIGPEARFIPPRRGQAYSWSCCSRCAIQSDIPLLGRLLPCGHRPMRVLCASSVGCGIDYGGWQNSKRSREWHLGSLHGVGELT